jgi:predicted metal-dependent peptidase
MDYTNTKSIIVHLNLWLVLWIKLNNLMRKKQMTLSIGKQLTAEQRIWKATTDIVGNPKYVALAGVMMIGSKKVVEDCPTACTNGRDELYGRAFVDMLNDAELRFLMLHECYHKMYRHLSTWKHLADIDAARCNKANDYVINIKLVDGDGNEGFIKMPKMGLISEAYRDMGTQEVFDLLPPEDNEGNGKGSGFDDHDWEGAQELGEEEAKDLAKQIDEAVRQGAMLAGKTGSGGNRDLADLLETKQDWRELLREFVKTTCAGKDFSTWKKPNRKYIGMDIYMPSAISEAVGEIVIAIDTSGSIGGRELSAFLGEIKGICDQVKPSKVRLIYWDTQVCSEEVYEAESTDDITKSTKPTGGGGTDVSCVSKYMSENGLKPECVVVLTDGYLGNEWGSWTVPVLWAVLNNKSARPPMGVKVDVSI